MLFGYLISGISFKILSNRNLNTTYIQNLVFKISTLSIANALDINNEPGLYQANSETQNLPIPTYGIVLFLKLDNNGWVYSIFIPTDVSGIYMAFYNGYSQPAAWTNWKAISSQQFNQ